ncbi:MAG TPA: hypothetical protein PLY56_09830 [Armatimonadota bacterium]|nr:hypothetical protein [Armatimonadota bacterium]
MDVRDALKLLALRAPSLQGEALKALSAPPAAATLRYRTILQLALCDPEANWTDEERLALLDVLAPPSQGEERTEQLNIRLSPSEVAIVRMMAEAEGMTVSAYVRKRILSE